MHRSIDPTDTASAARVAWPWSPPLQGLGDGVGHPADSVARSRGRTLADYRLPTWQHGPED